MAIFVFVLVFVHETHTGSACGRLGSRQGLCWQWLRHHSVDGSRTAHLSTKVSALHY